MEELFHDTYIEIRSYLSIRTRIHWRCVSRLFYKWDKELVAPDYLKPHPLILAENPRSPVICRALCELMQSENKPLRDLMASLGYGKCQIAVTMSYRIDTFGIYFYHTNVNIVSVISYMNGKWDGWETLLERWVPWVKEILPHINRHVPVCNQ